jgi:hypothetical protein
MQYFFGPSTDPCGTPNDRIFSVDSNSLHDYLQSAYRACHSTETALLRVHHDITLALDNNSCAVLVMLDLSAAFRSALRTCSISSAPAQTLAEHQAIAFSRLIRYFRCWHFDFYYSSKNWSMSMPALLFQAYLVIKPIDNWINISTRMEAYLRDRPFNLKGGGLWFFVLTWRGVLCFFSKKIFWFPMLLKKIFWFWWRKKKKIWFRVFVI